MLWWLNRRISCKFPSWRISTNLFILFHRIYNILWRFKITIRWLNLVLSWIKWIRYLNVRRNIIIWIGSSKIIYRRLLILVLNWYIFLIEKISVFNCDYIWIWICIIIHIIIHHLWSSYRIYILLWINIFLISRIIRHLTLYIFCWSYRWIHTSITIIRRICLRLLSWIKIRYWNRFCRFEIPSQR